MKNRTDATQLFSKDQAMHELDELKFAVAALVEVIAKPGTVEQELGHNAVREIKQRLDYLHDSFRQLLEG